jgi:endonuclease/exonuclease/phosphatase family metal-dependent hydrolase
MKLLTWNIQWGRGADGRVDLDRIVADAGALADFDVLCLQEVSSGYTDLPGCNGEDQFEILAGLLPSCTALVGAAVDLPAEGRRFGNLMLSRLPVRQVFRHLLPWPAEAGVKSMQRIVIEATVATAFGPLRVMTTHLEYYSDLQRKVQIERMRELHREAVAHARCPADGRWGRGPFALAPRGGPAVLAGDFNFRPESAERKLLLRLFEDGTPAWRDAWEVTHTGQGHEPTLGVHDKEQWPGPPFTSDYVFVSEDLAQRVCDVRVDATTIASDHQPMLLELH